MIQRLTFLVVAVAPLAATIFGNVALFQEGSVIVGLGGVAFDLALAGVVAFAFRDGFVAAKSTMFR